MGSTILGSTDPQKWPQSGDIDCQWRAVIMALAFIPRPKTQKERDALALLFLQCSH